MFKSFVLLVALLLSTICEAQTKHGTFIYAWNHPTLREDGSSFAFEEISKYQVYWKLQSATEFIVVDLPATTLVFEKLVSFGYYNVKVRVCDLDNLCSDFTKLRSFELSAHPTKPGYTTLRAGKAQ